MSAPSLTLRCRILNPAFDPVNPSMFVIRPASADDQSRISNMIRDARLFPFGIKWQRFLVAEEQGEVIGIVQLKTHRLGAQELASLTVIPDRQHQGVAATLIHAVLAEAPGAVYLDCHVSLEPFYQKFGFRRLSWVELPLDFKRIRLFLWLISPLAHIATKGKFHILIMGRAMDVDSPRREPATS